MKEGVEILVFGKTVLLVFWKAALLFGKWNKFVVSGICRASLGCSRQLYMILQVH